MNKGMVKRGMVKRGLVSRVEMKVVLMSRGMAVVSRQPGIWPHRMKYCVDTVVIQEFSCQD